MTRADFCAADRPGVPRPFATANPPRIHSPICPCDQCQPAPGPADIELSGAAIAAWSLAGTAIGLVLAKAIDWLVDGPGVLAMFGTWS